MQQSVNVNYCKFLCLPAIQLALPQLHPVYFLSNSLAFYARLAACTKVGLNSNLIDF